MTWTLSDRRGALERLAREGTELVVVGGGITGAGVLRDASLRGLKAALFERCDFASGTSSYTSKMIHGGLRYIAEGQLGVTRESCVERDLLTRLNPNLVRPLPFLFCAFDDGVPPWKMVAGLSLYRALAGFKSSAFTLLSAREVARHCRDVRTQGLRAAGLYYDAQVDDARIVLETLKDARGLGAEAVHHAQVVGFVKEHGRIAGVRVRDALHGDEHTIRAARVVNAAGPSVDRVRDLDEPLAHHELRPAKGVHLVIARERVHADAAVSFQARDMRHMFLCPWDDVHLIGTTDAFTHEIDEPRVSADEVRYVLDAVNRAFPRSFLTERDLVSVYAGVRPLVSPPLASVPPSSVSREHRITEDASGLVSVAGGKLTTYRHMAEQIVDRVVKTLPPERRRALRPCATRERPLRDDRFVPASFVGELCARFALEERTAERLMRTWGEAALGMLERASAEERAPIGRSRFLLCELTQSIREECAADLCDVLQRRVRVAMRVPGQGLSQLDALSQVAARAFDWDETRTREETERYRALVARRYQVSP